MEQNKNYKMSIVYKGMGKDISDYEVVLSITELPAAITYNAKNLLRLTPSKPILSESKEIEMQMINLSCVKLINREGKTYAFNELHEVRESVRRHMRNAGLVSQLEEINKKIVVEEFIVYIKLYTHYKEDRSFFTHYFYERFPEISKKKFNNNIGKMFRKYRDEFNQEDIPKQNVQHVEKSWRTADRGNRDYYRYPIKDYYTKKEVAYMTKAAICTIIEMELTKDVAQELIEKVQEVYQEV